MSLVLSRETECAVASGIIIFPHAKIAIIW